MYYQFKLLNCSSNQVDALQDALFGMGAVSVTLLEDEAAPIYEPLPGTTPYWAVAAMDVLFADCDTAKITKDLIEAIGWQCESIHEIATDGWELITQSAIKPMQYGKRLWVYPDWIQPQCHDPKDVIINLNPGLAFGTGNHNTTRMCLEWLEDSNLEKQSGIDYGCGSGILAIAALKLGALHMAALDLDPQALLATKHNASQNHVENKITIIDTVPQDFESVDFIIANILLQPLIELKNIFFKLLKNKGKLAITGILSEQLPIILAEYHDTFIVNKIRHNGDWALVELDKKL